MASGFVSAVLLLFSICVVAGSEEFRKLRGLIEKDLSNKEARRLEETTALDGCIGKKIVIFPNNEATEMNNLTISGVWMDGFLHYKIANVSLESNKVFLTVIIPEIMASAHVGPNIDNGTMLMMDFANHHVLLEMDLTYSQNGTHISVDDYRIVPKTSHKDDGAKSEFVRSLRKFMEARINKCSSVVAAQVKNHVEKLLLNTPTSQIVTGTSGFYSRRRRTRLLNRSVDRFLLSVQEELDNGLSYLRLRSFRLHFRRHQRGIARFYRGRLYGSHRLHRYRNVRYYKRGARWFVSVPLLIKVPYVRYRVRFRERNGPRVSDRVKARVRTVKLLWLLSQDSLRSGPTRVENVRMGMVSRPHFRTPELKDLQYAWELVRRRAERRTRVLVLERLQDRIERVLRDLVEGNRRRGTKGNQLFNV